ncbi:MAG: T9SS type A sorting domain-containing protein [Bacteroidales bacterium]|nr:T9SS type A sorting domain-containing protein [Bacteroidales bacterium]MBN2819711.1 T9SS type A sorting domain-containing protein [Bacteroidales bacterium]
MKKKQLLFIISLGLLISLLIIGNQKKEQLNNQWAQEYAKKQYNNENHIPKNKELKIGKLEEYFKGIRTEFGKSTSGYPANYLMHELKKLKSRNKGFKDTDTIEWVQRGPGNVGGRTRSVVVDITDPTHNTWFAGSATGGIWKTVNGGISWDFISNGIPYLAISTIIQSPSEPNILYAGTGESFPGSMLTTGGGVFKSVDKGNTWEQIAFTAGNEDFRYVNRLAIHPDSSNIVLAATTSGIYKTTDGEIWKEVFSSVYSVEDLKADTSDFNYLYAGVNYRGVVRSTDAGETWEYSRNGIIGTNGRFELAISPTNPSWVYVSVENNERGSDLYLSSDRGLTWNHIKNKEEEAIDYLGGQAGYDNTISVHPYSSDTVFVGGVNLWKIGVNTETMTGDGTITGFDTSNTQSFLTFVNFSSIIQGVSTGDQEEATDLDSTDFVDVEIRFGSGKSQKAHRFTVPDSATSGVLAADYTYKDYVNVPFEVWDVTNNRQLMCSFRDQEADGQFNLYERIGDDYGQLGREYIFINAVEYNADSPDTDIAVQGGRSYKLIYFLWPDLAADGTWEPENLPESYISIKYGYPEYRKGSIINVSDAYNNISGKNIYNQNGGYNKTSVPGFHPDHHALTIVPINSENKTFWIVNGNDGGLGISKDNGNNFTQIVNGYVTTQFYGVAKKPYRNEYIGGTQDNGTWQSPSFKEASLDEDFVFRLGGDGFETVWNLKDTNKILASSYENYIYLSKNHGASWAGVFEDINGDGPFITKLTMIPSNPDRVFAVGTEGFYYTTTFGESGWRLRRMFSGWNPNNAAVTSYHNIKYSIANDSILWAGAALTEEYNWDLFVSTDLARNFTAVNFPEPAMNAYFSNIATHPTEPNTAYLLYSLYGRSKILRTEDLGQSWEDITGFVDSDTSINGFPDVGCLSLLVFPDNPQRIWAGTELGIVESLDNGATWNLLESSLPTIPVWQMFMQDNQIVVATYGKGIWTYQYGPEVDPPVPSLQKEIQQDIDYSSLLIYPNPSKGYVNIELSDLFTDSHLTIKVYNSFGQVVKSFSMSNNGKVEIDLSDLIPGNYFISVQDKQKTISSRIIIQ